MNLTTLTSTSPYHEPQEAEVTDYDFWSAPGHIEFFVVQNAKDVFEIEVIDYSGCAYGLQDTLGIEYYITDCWYLQEDPSTPLREGVTYTLHDLTVTWTRGDGWTTDDDVEYDFSKMTSHATAFGYLSHKLKMIWWRAIGSKLQRASK